MSDVAQIAPPPELALDRPGRDRLWHPHPILCAVCTSRTRGFGWFDPHRPRRSPGNRPPGPFPDPAHRTRRWFCSMGCQAAFTRKALKGLSMVDFTEEETQALPAVMRALGPEMERIGWDRPLASLTANDMQRLIVTTVAAFRAEMRAITSQSEIPF